MRGTLIGTDYLYQGDDVKVLEINTNTAIISKGVEHLDLNPFFQFLQGWEFSEFHFIYSEAMTIGRDGDSTIFLDTLQQRCDDIGITFVKHEVDADAITIPNVEDSEDKFILRQAYDASAIVDSLYCNDKMEFLNLMSGSDDIPESYYSSSDGFFANTIDLDTDIDASEPNGIVKSRYPAYDMEIYPSIKRYGTEEELTSDINNLESEDYIIQEFLTDAKNFVDGRSVVMRGFDIIYAHDLQIISLGGYRMSSNVPMSFAATAFEDDGITFDSLSRTKYITKALAEKQKIPYHTDLESDILMSDGSIGNISTIQVGDTITSTLFELISGSEHTVEPSDDYLEHYGSMTVTTDTLSTTGSELQSIVSQSMNTMFVKATFSDNSIMIDSPTSEVYIKTSGSAETTQFEFVNKLLVGDSIVYYNSGSNEITSKEITNLEMVWQNDVTIYNLDFEPYDYFLVDSKQGDGTFSIMHNICTYCSYPWAGCGHYYCDNNCGYAGCSGGGFSGKSERHLKTDIEFIGESKMGIPMYHFNYKDVANGIGRFIGTMVDDLQRLGFEDVLIHSEDGILVDYNKIDVPFGNISN